jgi:PREDICTED: similar to rab3 GTPase-activating protein, non-catalytic subunit
MTSVFTLFTFQLQFSGVLDEMDEGETITAICCLPFVSLQVSNQGRPDWTCIILGFNSGIIRIYTENMSLLLEQKVHDESITSIKVRSFHSPYFDGRTLQINALENADEIIFCLKSLVVICEGYAFFQTLRSCRTNLARTSSYQFPSRASASEFSLSLKKYTFPNSQQVQDCDSCGIHVVNFYDKLTFHSLTRGPYGNPKSKSISGHFFISSGQDPFIGIHRAEGVCYHLLVIVNVHVNLLLICFRLKVVQFWTNYHRL